MDAWDELHEMLEDGETLECIIFGDHDYGSCSGAADPGHVPVEARDRVMPIAEAEPYMRGWSTDTGYCGVGCYKLYAWSDRNVFFVSEYDSSTCLASIPRHPPAG